MASLPSSCRASWSLEDCSSPVRCSASFVENQNRIACDAQGRHPDAFKARLMADSYRRLVSRVACPG
eukprot:scaffold30263_cov52-Phaeocystis_antarctica.AAC.1